MLGSPLPGVFRGQYAIPYAEADATGALRFTSLIKLVQSQAGDHTASLGWDFREHFDQGIFWVLSRMSVEFRTWPTWPCDLTVDTWTRGTKAVLALRDFRFGTEELGWCGRSSTAWVVLKDRKPQRPEPYTKIYTPMQAEDPLAEVPPSLPPLENAPEAQGLAESLARVTHSVWATWEDIDLNGHVGNVNSLGWCLDRHDFAFLRAHRPAFLDVNYLAEMFCGEKFTIILREALPEASGNLRVFDYAIMRATDQVVTLRMRMGFGPIADTVRA
ncbi:MAG: acyl-ACP thioesterase domain-containing protein [Spirochaetales bacterium]